MSRSALGTLLLVAPSKSSTCSRAMLRVIVSEDGDLAVTSWFDSGIFSVMSDREGFRLGAGSRDSMLRAVESLTGVPIPRAPLALRDGVDDDDAEHEGGDDPEPDLRHASFAPTQEQARELGVMLVKRNRRRGRLGLRSCNTSVSHARSISFSVVCPSKQGRGVIGRTPSCLHPTCATCMAACMGALTKWTRQVFTGPQLKLVCFMLNSEAFPLLVVLLMPAASPVPATAEAAALVHAHHLVGFRHLHRARVSVPGTQGGQAAAPKPESLPATAGGRHADAWPRPQACTRLGSKRTWWW